VIIILREKLNINGYNLMSEDDFLNNMKRALKRVHMEQLEIILNNSDYVFTTKPKVEDGDIMFQTLCNNSLELLKNAIGYHKLKGNIYCKDYKFNVSRISNIKEVK
jgi:hypothetical protein